MRYLSPFELTGTDPSQPAAGHAALSAARKRILAEFELTGNASTIRIAGGEYTKTDLLALLDSLSDPQQLDYHAQVAGDKALTAFLRENEIPAGGKFDTAADFFSTGFKTMLSPYFTESHAVCMEQAFKKRDLKALRNLAAMPLLCADTDTDACFRGVRLELLRITDEINKVLEERWPYRFEAREAELFANATLLQAIDTLPAYLQSARDDYARHLLELALYIHRHRDRNPAALQLAQQVSGMKVEASLVKKAKQLSLQLKNDPPRPPQPAPAPSYSRPSGNDSGNSWKIVVVVIKVIILIAFIGRSCDKRSSRFDYNYPTTNRLLQDYQQQRENRNVARKIAMALLEYQEAKFADTLAADKKKKKRKKKTAEENIVSLNSGRHIWCDLLHCSESGSRDKILFFNRSGWDVIAFLSSDFDDRGAGVYIRAKDTVELELPLLIKAHCYFYAGRNWNDTVYTGNFSINNTDAFGTRMVAARGRFMQVCANYDSLLRNPVELDRLAMMRLPSKRRSTDSYSSTYPSEIKYYIVIKDVEGGGIRLVSNLDKGNIQ